jgi:predicted dehydrogenase
VQDKLKCGVIGAGWWATFAHIPALLGHPNAELIAIQNNSREEAQKIAHDFMIPVACTEVEELLAIDGISAVVVSSSPNLHYKDAAAALARGKHVLVEKPMTLTVAEAMDLTRIAEEHGTQFLISCPWHYTTHASEAQRLVRDGYLGEIRMISILMTNPISDLLRGEGTQPTHGTPYMHPREGTYSDPKLAGGGQIYAQVCHAAAYLTFLTGARPTEVFARFHNDGAVLDIYDALNLRMDDGSIVTLASTGATSRERRDFEVRVFGTKGMLFLDLWRGKMEFIPMVGDPRTYPDLHGDEVYPHEAPAHNLIDSILEPLRNRSPATFGVAAMEVIEAACLSARTGENILVSSLLEQAQWTR